MIKKKTNSIEDDLPEIKKTWRNVFLNKREAIIDVESLRKLHDEIKDKKNQLTETLGSSTDVDFLKQSYVKLGDTERKQFLLDIGISPVSESVEEDTDKKEDETIASDEPNKLDDDLDANLDELDENNLDFNIISTGDGFSTYGNKNKRLGFFEGLDQSKRKESYEWLNREGIYGIVYHGITTQSKLEGPIRGGGLFGILLQIPVGFKSKEKIAVKSILSDTFVEIINSEKITSITSPNKKSLLAFRNVSDNDINQIEKILRDKIIAYKSKLQKSQH